MRESEMIKNEVLKDSYGPLKAKPAVKYAKPTLSAAKIEALVQDLISNQQEKLAKSLNKITEDLDYFKEQTSR
jgi:hypothetical protein